ncbi:MULTISPECIES: hypothetical protein [Glycomyces]|uniref:Uncharacterized protein n=2 Tax=Glycomyces TaxID=58113 RepID=A0A9X3PMT7_9ACTN|nr:hypothetical protein [Glycomyces lechevalierae]MDA1388374.1 hypothetical protein [Glycomyces lechevalierae]MDR7340335.1 hypothetical protein [Glycomyces lechevalierae]
MHPAAPLIKVRHRPAVPAVMTALGALTLVGAITLMTGPAGTGAVGFLLAAVISLTIGALQFAKPYCVFEPATGTLRLIDLFGHRDKVLGAPAGELLFFNGRNLIRVLPDGASAPVKTWPGHPADLRRLSAALPGHHA